ncbi:MAG: hypothetical protein AB7T49_10110 [Oligoflexales bacterium]
MKFLRLIYAIGSFSLGLAATSSKSAEPEVAAKTPINYWPIRESGYGEISHNWGLRIGMEMGVPILGSKAFLKYSLFNESFVPYPGNKKGNKDGELYNDSLISENSLLFFLLPAHYYLRLANEPLSWQKLLAIFVLSAGNVKVYYPLFDNDDVLLYAGPITDLFLNSAAKTVFSELSVGASVKVLEHRSELYSGRPSEGHLYVGVSKPFLGRLEHRPDFLVLGGFTYEQ